MTIIYEDGKAPRWVEIPQPKRRKSPRALRFAELKVGDQLMQKPADNWHRKIPAYFVVTDMWSDPVAGQRDPVAGQMAAIVRINETGEPHGSKSGYPIRGLASQQFHYADIDYIEHAKSREAAKTSGAVIGIGAGRAIRARPKMPGQRS